MGTPAFAVPSLRAAMRDHEVVAVYTRPDRVRSRGSAVSASPVKLAALDAGIPVEQPASIAEAGQAEALAAYRPDVAVVAAYGAILPRGILSVPRHGCVNVHASLLPALRGAAPVQRAILDGVDPTGASIMLMDEGLDTGPVARTVTVPVGGRYLDDLTQAIAEAGAEALLDVLRDIGRGCVEWMPQDESAATYATKISREDVAIDPGTDARTAWLRLRASSGSAPVRVRVADAELTVHTASPLEDGPGAGCVTIDGALVLGMRDGGLRLDEVTPSGKRRMRAADWLRGARVPARATWARA